MKPIKEGKVREIYDNGDSLIMVATDRISCFDELDNNQMSIGQPFFGYKRYGGRDKGKKNSWVINDDVFGTFKK